MSTCNDCHKCIHYEVCCSWTSKDAIDAANEAMEDGTCSECNHFKPTSDVVEGKHGTWLCQYDSRCGTTDVTCSVCGDTRTVNGCYTNHLDEPIYNEDNYCPQCGAYMRG